MDVLLNNYIRYKGYDIKTVSPMIDHSSISTWAIEAVESVSGIISGLTENSFEPQATMTRAEVAGVFVRLVGAINQ